MPEFTGMMETLIKAGKEMNKWHAVHAQLVQDLARMGYPCVTGGVTFTAYDWICVLLRGLEGTMMDMYRQPDNLKAAVELLIPTTIEMGLMASKVSGYPRVFFPMWRGSNVFMSDRMFAEFYWPSFKALILALIEADLTPAVWFQGDYTDRLRYLAELPRGKVAGHFDMVDKKKAKEIIGDTMCFWGNVPPQLLVTGTPQQVKDYVKQLIDIFCDTGGLIVDGAVEGVPAESKPENVEAMTEAVFEYGVY